jgi:hypothetical protein
VTYKFVSGWRCPPSASRIINGLPEGGVRGRQAVQLVVRVQAARVRQHPQQRALEGLRLAADDGPRAIERGPVRRYADDRHGRRPETANGLAESSPTGTQLQRSELGGRGRGAVDQVRYADPGSQ